MKIGLSSYSISRAIRAGEMDILGAVRWVAENGGEHIEIVPSGFVLTGDDALTDAVRKQAAECGIDLSSYTIGANFLTAGEDAHETSENEYRAEIDRDTVLNYLQKKNLDISLCFKSFYQFSLTESYINLVSSAVISSSTCIHR